MPFFYKNKSNFIKMFKENYPSDLKSGFVVFMVALPLCLGIAAGSNAPLFSGIIAGIIGGIIVGYISGSAVGVSGPAAGLTTIVAAAILSMGDWSTFTLAVLFAGIIQLIAGFLKAGVITHFFPNAVIKGMLVSIGLVIVIKQIPHAFGYDADFEGDFAFHERNHENSFSELWIMFQKMHGGALLISAIALPILFLWELKWAKVNKFFKAVPGPLAIIILGIAFNELYKGFYPQFILTGKELVELPILYKEGTAGHLLLPDFSQWNNLEVYKTAIIIALIASIETLLSTRATDKLDPMKRTTPADLELKAQGIGNIVSGLIGGLPVTQVIVRSSANITFGAKSKWSAIFHGFYLLIAVIAIPTVLNLIPMAVLACVLLFVGYKLINPEGIIAQFKLGWTQFIPFAVTIIATLTTDLLTGVGIGFLVSILYLIFAQKYKTTKFSLEKNEFEKYYKINLPIRTHFLGKQKLLQLLEKVPAKSSLIIESNSNHAVDYDIRDLINDYTHELNKKSINLTLIGFK